jgi:hypothetical protein
MNKDSYTVKGRVDASHLLERVVEVRVLGAARKLVATQLPWSRKF